MSKSCHLEVFRLGRMDGSITRRRRLITWKLVAVHDFLEETCNREEFHWECVKSGFCGMFAQTKIKLAWIPLRRTICHWRSASSRRCRALEIHLLFSNLFLSRNPHRQTHQALHWRLPQLSSALAHTERHIHLCELYERLVRWTLLWVRWL